MATSTTPLLRERPDDDESDIDTASTSSGEHRHWFRRITSRSNVVPYVFTLIATIILVTTITLLARTDMPKRKNVILMVSDGMGPASLSFARSFMQYTQGVEFSTQLPLDPYIIGTSRTRSHSSLITDSAAGATAFACGIKTYNRGIAIDPSRHPCGTVLEAAKLQGYMTGMVVTAKITDATPACFASHVVDRRFENAIAEQLIGNGPLNRTVDLLFGGGRCHFLPQDHHESCRSDDKDLLAQATEKGFTYIPDRAAFDSLAPSIQPSLPLMGLFSPGHMSYSIDRAPQSQPSLAEMTRIAIEALHAATKDSQIGFFLLIEGSRIDMASHSNDPVGHVHDVLEYNSAFDVARTFIDQFGGVLISTSDHETGGISVGRQVTASYPDYIWYPEVLVNATHSTEYLGYKVAAYTGFPGDINVVTVDDDIHKYIEKTIVQKGLGIHDATKEEIKLLVKYSSDAVFVAYILSDMISRRARIGWSTHGHSAVDVNIYAYGDPVLEKLRGNHENTEIGRFIEEYLDLDLDAVSQILNSGAKSWMHDNEEDTLRLQDEFGRRHH